MFGFVLLAFLLLAVVLAVAVFFAFKSGQAGQTKLSGPAGCMVALALLLIAGIGAIGLVIVALVTLPSEAVRRGPVKSLEWRFPAHEDEATSPDSPARADDQGTSLTIELRGLQDPSEVMKWLRKRTDSGTHIAVHEGKDEDGKPMTVIELTLPESHDVTRELRDMRRDLEEDEPDLRLPSSVKIVFRGPDDE
jgi:hypothetical protein